MNLQTGFELLARLTHHGDTSEASSTVALDHSPATAERLNTKFGAARLIRQLRIRAGLSQKELAARLHMSVPEIMAIEIGDRDCLQTLQVSDHVKRMIG